jgi:hypothetical protein
MIDGKKSAVKLPKPGLYEIEVAKVIRVNPSIYAGGSEDVVVKDKKGKTWAIPEDHSHKPGNRLFSRYDVKEGMKLRLKVSRIKTGPNFIAREITEAVIIN